MRVSNQDKLKFERIKDMPVIKRQIVKHLFDFLKRKRSDMWWFYNGDFKYEGRDYHLECQCRMDNVMLTFRFMHIEYKQVVIDVDAMNKNGLLN